MSSFNQNKIKTSETDEKKVLLGWGGGDLLASDVGFAPLIWFKWFLLVA